MRIMNFIGKFFKREHTLVMPTSPPKHPKKDSVYLFFSDDGSFAEEPFSFVKEKEKLIQNIKSLELDKPLEDVLIGRVDELSELSESSHLSSIFLSGSILEGALYGLAKKYPGPFNENGPKHSKNFYEWKLCEFLDAAKKIGLINQTQSYFSKNLMNYRNTIHPREQLKANIKTMTKEDLQVTMFALEVVLSQISKSSHLLTNNKTFL